MQALQKLEQQGQRVLTTAQLAEAYGADTKQINDNFQNNESRYTLGKHYFVLQGEELKNFKASTEISGNLKYAPVLYLWTEKGAWLHAKSLNTDQAWEAYERLVDEYFRILQIQQPVVMPSYMVDDPIKRAERWIEEYKERQQLETQKLILEQRVAEYEPKITYLDQILQSKDTVTITQIAKDYGLSGQSLNKILHEAGVQFKQNGQWLLYRKHQDKGYTKSYTVDVLHNSGSQTAKMNTRWTQKGRLFIHDLLTQRGIVAMIDRKDIGA